MKEFIVRPYKTDDKDSIIRLWRECHLIVPQNDPEKEIAEKISFQPELFFVVQIDKKLIGTIMVGYDGHRGWINYLAVHPMHRRGGIATKLMEHATRILSDLGCSKINVQIREKNESVINFYEKLGFTDDHVISFGKRL